MEKYILNTHQHLSFVMYNEGAVIIKKFSFAIDFVNGYF